MKRIIREHKNEQKEKIYVHLLIKLIKKNVCAQNMETKPRSLPIKCGFQKAGSIQITCWYHRRMQIKKGV